MKDIFISYRSTQYDKATALRSALEAQGFSCWMAPESIPGGSSYLREIPKAIRTCPVFVLLLTEDAQAEDSKWVPREVEMAINRRRLVLPLFKGGFQANETFEFLLNIVQSYTGTGDWFTPPEPMITRIRNYLGNQKKEPVPEPVEQSFETGSQPADPDRDWKTESEPVEEQDPWDADFWDQDHQEPDAREWVLEGAWTDPGELTQSPEDYVDVRALRFRSYADNCLECKDYQEALRCYKDAAELGDAYSMWKLGCLYFFEEAGCQDLSRACYWYEQAANQGYLPAMYDLARYHEQYTQNYPQAFYWYQQASDKSIEAMQGLARCYLMGRGTGKDAARGVHLLERAAGKGSSKAKFNLALLYLEGKAVIKNESRAVKFFRELADGEGYGDAQYYLGYCYFSGKGVIRNPKRAGHLYLQAMNNGFFGVPYEDFKLGNDPRI